MRLAPPAGLLGILGTSTRPAFTHYSAGPDGPTRVELSGKVLAQWAYKCANLLHEEGYGAGDTVHIDLAISWRALPWTLGAWLQDCTVIFHPGTPDVLITHEPTPGGTVIAVPRDPLALRFPDPLPSSILDGAADAAAQPDTAVAPSTAELDESIGIGPGGRRLLEPTTVPELVWGAVAQWRAGGSVLVVDPLITGEQRERILAQENIAS